MYDEEVEAVIEKVARQIKGDWIDAWNYLDKLAFKGLDLTEGEKEILRKKEFKRD